MTMNDSRAHLITKNFYPETDINPDAFRLKESSNFQDSKEKIIKKSISISSSDNSKSGKEKVRKQSIYTPKFNEIKNSGQRYTRKLERLSKIITFSSDEEQKEEALGGRWIISLESSWKLRFDYIIAILVFYCSIMIPYRASMFDSKTSLYLIYEDVILGLLFLIDLIMNFFTSYIGKDKLKIEDLKMIVRTYLSSWFIYDFLSMIPFNIILSSDYKIRYYSKNTFILPFLKLSKLIRIIKLFNNCQSLAISTFMESSLKLKSLIKYSTMIILFLHIASCFWKMLAIVFEFNNKNWVSAFNLYNLSEFEIYYESLFFIMTTVTTVGYGRIYPVNALERFFTTVVMIMAVYLYSFAVGKLSNIFEITSANEKIRIEKLKALKAINSEYNLKEDFLSKLKSHIKNEKNSSHIKLSNFVNQFNDSIKLELVGATLNKKISNFQFFRKKSRDFIIYVARQLHFINYLDNEYIYKCGQYMKESKYALSYNYSVFHCQRNHKLCTCLRIWSN